MIKHLVGVACGVFVFNVGAAFGLVLADKERARRDAQYERMLRSNAYGALIGFEVVRDMCDFSTVTSAKKAASRYIQRLTEALDNAPALD